MQRWVVALGFLALLFCTVFADEESPNGGHSKDGQACCQHTSNGYECCPFDQAECCGDHVHCCPAFMSCDVEQSRCVNASLSVPWAERTPTEQPRLSKSFRMIRSHSKEDDENICPDQSRCPAEYSCLRALTKYGCCPLAQGIPCSDGKHCCPQGHSCSKDSRSCVKKDVSSTVLCSDGVSECPEESSCCEGADGEFSCCPMPQAVCCDDKIHCCPEGSLCDLETSKCNSVSSKKQLPMWAKFPARRRAEWEDQKEEQHVTSETATGSEHEESKAEELATTIAEPGSETCDHYTRCPDLTTCCSNGSGGWYCCPLVNAVCCSNHLYCCQHLTSCDTIHHRCLKGNASTAMIQTTAALTFDVPSTTAGTEVSEPDQTKPGPSEQTESEEEDEDEEDEDEDDDVAHRVHCRGHKNHTCPKNSTCCNHKQHKRHCCPFPNATCCDDGKHCCPQKFQCHPPRKTCVKDGMEIPWYTKFPVLPSPQPRESHSVVNPAERASDVQCDTEVSCPDKTTCCSDGQGGWGCCPEPNAVCCSDHQSCCPHGTACDLEHMQCVNASDPQTTPMTPRRPSFPTTAPSTTASSTPAELASKATCDVCSDTETCCSDGQGGWGCCPKPNAVCCSDHQHCCPQGTLCDLEHMTCVSTSDSQTTPMTTRTSAFTTTAPPAAVEMQVTVTRPGQSEQAKTKEDEKDEDDEEDNDDDDEGVEQRVHCQGHRNFTCPRNSTCCRSRSHRAHCCPLLNARCCGRGKGCCPQGYKCFHKKRTCVKDGVEIAWYSQVPALPSPKPVYEETQVNKPAKIEPVQTEQTESKKEEEDENDDDKNNNDEDTEDDDEDEDRKVHCNSTTSCPGHCTCCKSGDDWGCCPLKSGVCCPDGKNCCPHHSKCTESGCVHDDDVMIPWFIKLPTLSDLETVSDKTVICPDGAHCPDKNTCCQMSNGNYGCCPLENAVCSSDKMHCCPSGFSCDPIKLCHKSLVLDLEIVPLTPAQSKPQEENGNCGNITCKAYEKCCHSGGPFFCCPFKTDVCCPNNNCCRYNKRCAQYGGCISNSLNPWENWPFFKKDKKNPLML